MVAIYARQSIDKRDSVSIETQIDRCQRYSDGEPLVFQDKGFSGKNTNRPDFHRLMKAVETGQIQKIIVYRLDRFSRSISDFSQIWDRLEKHNVEFQSVTENFDTSSPMGRAMLNIVLVFAQLERETIAERVRDNYQHRFSLGAWPGGPAPYGYSLTKQTDAAGRQVPALEKNEDAAVVHRIFDLYNQEGVSLRKVARLLNEEGISGPRRKTWDNVTLARMLHSPVYTQANEDVFWWYQAKGMQCSQPVEMFDGSHACNVIGKRDRSKGKYNDLEKQKLSLSNHQGFIAPELWLACQRKLDQNVQIPNKQGGKHSWLTGLLKCGSCGYAIKINRDSRSGKFYLICSGRSNMGACDQSIQIDLKELEEEVSQQICRFLKECPTEEVYPPNNETVQELQRIEERIDRLVNALAESSEVSFSYINTQIKRFHSQKEELLKKMKTDFNQTVERRKLDFETATFEEKQIIAREFIDRIFLADDCADIHWKL